MELRIKPLGLFALALLLLGISLGVTRLLNRGVASAENAPRSGSNGVRGGGEVLLVTSKTKKDWLQTEIEKFNAKNQGRLTVKVEFLETRDALQEILNGKVKPALWAPSSPIWTSRLGEAWSVGHGGKKLLSVSDPATFRIYLRTPMVILTTKEKAPALRAILGGSDPWNGLRGLNTGSRSVPWGTFKYTYADPLNANSGFLTLGMILADYGQRTQPSVDLKIVAESDGFKSFVRDLNTKLVYDEPSRKGSSDLFKAFLADPNRYDFITTYESNAIGAAEKNPELAVIYPMPTAVAEQSVVL
ncbi:MAG: substrate-binding domain-containing protein, partial [Cytophagales bacterium]|nr:substrate-binding domain-containing protein [Armatimonadota bacterium]